MNPVENRPVISEEVMLAAKQLQNDKAPGNESGGLNLVHWLHRAVLKVWETAHAPEDWIRDCIIPF